MTAADEDRRRQLAVTAAELGAEVVRLAKAAETQATEMRNLRVEVARKTYHTAVKIRIMIVLVVLDLALTGIGAWLIHQVDAESNAQAATSSQLSGILDNALCPLYKVFVSSYNPQSLAAKSQGIDRYNAIFVEIRRQYSSLGCESK